MSLLTRLCQIIVFISLFLAIYLGWFTSIFSNNERLNGFLDGTGIYSATSQLISKQLGSQIVGNDPITKAFKDNLGQIITPALVKKMLQPTQIVIIDWLQMPDGDDKLDLIIDLSVVKNQLLSTVTDPKVQFELKKTVPDSAVLTSEEFRQGPGLAAMRQLKWAYRFASAVFPISLVICISVSILIFLLNLRRGSKKITRLAAPYLAAGLVGLLMAGLLSLLSPTSINLDDQAGLGLSMLFAILRVATGDNVWLFGLIAGVSVSCIVVSKVIFRKKDKTLKGKRK